MKNKMKNIIALITLLFIGANTHAQTEFLVAAGSSSGTYQQFLKQISAVTTDSGIVFKEVPSHGAIENLDLLVNNRVYAAFMHSDVIYFRGQTEDLSRFKTLLALFSEDVHFLALSTSKRAVGGFGGFGAKPIVINDVSSLQGMKVGAAGGSYVTAQVIRLQSQIGYDVTQFEKGADVMNALNSGVIDAAVFVGAAPLPNLEELGRDYKLLSFPSGVVDRLKQVYKPTSITYNKMSPNSVSTVSAQCLLVSKTYKTKKIVDQLSSFRKQFFSKLDEIKETPGNHKKWSEVSEEEKGRWPYLELNETPAK